MGQVVQEYHGSPSNEGHVASLHAFPHVYVFNLYVFIHNLTAKISSRIYPTYKLYSCTQAVDSTLHSKLVL